MESFQRTRGSVINVNPNDTSRIWQVAERVYSNQLAIRFPESRVELLTDEVLTNLCHLSITAACRFVAVWDEIEEDIVRRATQTNQARRGQAA
jgi:hypothetical protein